MRYRTVDLLRRFLGGVLARTPGPKVSAALAALVVAIVAVSVAIAATPIPDPATGEVKACYLAHSDANETEGALRIVSGDLGCSAPEVAVSWDTTPDWADLQEIPAALRDGTIRWKEVKVKPAGFADDIDNDLLAEAPLNACANGKVAKRIAGVWGCGDDAGNWATLTNIPAGFADNTDNDALKETPLNSCPNGKVVKRVSGAWGCGDDAGNWTALTNIPASFADNVDNVGDGAVSDAFGRVNCPPGQMVRRIDGVWGCASVQAISGALPVNLTMSMDSLGSFVEETSITIGADGLPVMSYWDSTYNDLKVLHCGNALCTSGSTATTVDDVGNVGRYSAIAVGADGLPVVSYYRELSDDLKVLHCGNALCSSGNTATTVDSVGDVGQHTAITIGADGLPIVSYLDVTNFDLKVLHCGSALCNSGNTRTTVDSAGVLGLYSSITVGADGLPIVSYYGNSAVLNVLHCGDLLCSSGNTITTVDGTGEMGFHTSVTVGADGLPVISYFERGTNFNLRVVHCGNSLCDSGNTATTVDSDGDVGRYTSVTVGADGLPVVSYFDSTNGNLKVVHCGNSLCNSGNTATAVDSVGDVGLGTSVTIGADGLPIVSYVDSTPGDLRVLHCGNALCSNGDTITTLDAAGVVGEYSSITVGADGLPVMSYYKNSTGHLMVLHCGNTLCSIDNTITTADSAGVVGLFTAITLGADGMAVVSYYDSANGNLKVLHCGNALCNSGNTATTVDSVGDVGYDTSIAVGADGLPVVSYLDVTNFNLKVLHCGNLLCSSGNTVTTVDSSGLVGEYTSITVGADGLPVVSYQDVENGELKVLHCGNARCSTGLTIATVDSGALMGLYPSIAAGADGLPVVSYYDGANGDLKMVHCGNALCNSGNTASTVDSAGDVGLSTSITVGVDGLPVVSYRDGSNGVLKVLHCGNALCTSGNMATTVDSAADVGSYSSIAVGADGLPVVSYFDITNDNLKVLHCVMQTCGLPVRRR